MEKEWKIAAPPGAPARGRRRRAAPPRARRPPGRCLPGPRRQRKESDPPEPGRRSPGRRAGPGARTSAGLRQRRSRRRSPMQGRPERRAPRGLNGHRPGADGAQEQNRHGMPGPALRLDQRVVVLATTAAVAPTPKMGSSMAITFCTSVSGALETKRMSLLRMGKRRARKKPLGSRILMR